ncbi:hypothetical protein WA026_013528 [Henosepilachna vigintioctopunctata]|uniref:Uncharacterized protein n=1 Tax=Henosepilachna vigintioctopunctata TaxID=420089 RepID=A0AAW1VF17_9CUCU
MAAQILSGYPASLAMGALGGFILGNLTMKMTRKAGCAAGLGIIGYEVAHYNGLVKTSLDTVFGKVTQKLSEGCSKYCAKSSGQVKSLVGKNKALSVGLIGGSLLGIACS